MTGYGKGESFSEKHKVTIELKSVNGRFLDLNIHLPRALTFAEDTIKKIITSKVSRGTVDVFYTYENTGDSDKKAILDETLAKGYIEAGRLLSEYGLNNDITVATLLNMPEVIKIMPVEDDVEEITRLFAEATEKAVIAFNDMRTVEGESAKIDLLEKVSNIEDALNKVMIKAPSVSKEYKDKLEKRISELLDKAPVDEQRIAMEVAMFADKCDINEEISRLSSHIQQFNLIASLDEPLGRKLDFLSQEMNREINTMGSKANDLELTQNVIFMKNELEKIREQIRNVE